MGPELNISQFELPAPTREEIARAAERLSGLAVRVSKNYIEFEALPGAGVEVLCDETDVALRHEGFRAPTLYILLQHALVDLGGKFRTSPEPLDLPLTAEAVRARDKAERRAVGLLGADLVLRLPALLVGAVFRKRP
jgi:hypothetical protein